MCSCGRDLKKTLSVCVCDWVHLSLFVFLTARNLLLRPILSFIIYKQMRIRKRPVPFPLSSLSPVPLSDPINLNLNSPSPVLVQLHHCDSSPPTPARGLAHVLPLPSDRPNQHISPIGGGNNGCDVSDAGGEHKDATTATTTTNDRKDDDLVSLTTTLLTISLPLILSFLILL